MYLVNWFQANALMIGMTVVLVGLPIVLLVYAFSGKSEKKDSTEE